MSNAIATISIAAPCAQLFRFFSSPVCWRDALVGFVKIEMLTPTPFGVGTRWRQERRAAFAVDREEVEVARFDPPRSIELRIDGAKGSLGPGVVWLSYELMPHGSKTELVVSARIELHKPAPRWVHYLFIMPIRRSAKKDLRAIKAYVEAGLLH